ncbi:universal stress protein [Kitasatospora sp. NPDC051853]|uniref:universal stress protein n=1 Tax=Kitasatospora sp. NPDC051853 TaxID=3364058 RepID=UPI0037ACDAE5
MDERDGGPGRGLDVDRGVEQGADTERDALRPRRIVVGVSGSLGSLAALHRAVGEGRRTGAEVLAVLAWLPQGGEIGYRRAPCPPLLAVWEESATARLAEALEAAFGVGGPVGVRLSSCVVRGETVRALTLFADRPDDLVVVGAGSGSRLRRGLRASVPAECLRRVVCPVLVVPRPPLQREWEGRSWRHLWQLPVEAVPVTGAGGVVRER